MNRQALNDAGKLDQGFGDGGVVAITVAGYPSVRFTCVNIGPDKKIYCAGISERELDPNQVYTLGRFNADGTVDSGFGIAGFAYGIYPGYELSKVQSLAFQPDGKIIVACTVYTTESREAPALSRYGADGWLDPEFGTHGRTVLDITLTPPAANTPSTASGIPSGNGSTPHGVEVLPDGKILTFQHYYFNPEQSHGLIIRLDNKGTLDPDFNQTGYIPVIHPAYALKATVLRNIMVQTDGKYLGCGNVYGNADRPNSALFVRYDSTGQLDPGFGDGGFVTVVDGTHSILLEGMVQQPNQRILGFGSTLFPNYGSLISIEPDGSPNIQFNGGKPLNTVLEDDATGTWEGAAIQKDGKIVVAGGIAMGREVDIVVARFIDAQFDPAFNEGQGWVRTHLENGAQYATGMTLQEDGKILVCARLPNNKSVLLRYLA
ncbi:hypothetical protein ACIOWE_11765 [Pseudomonas sp. NPDC087598]|uniref:hypothetical protein n=1 Tax=Pseudomonas sp. NPDC087598 TaxID=3364440 RepID=UPI003817729E